MNWKEFNVYDESSYPPQDEPVLVSFYDSGWKVGVATLKYRGKYGGYYWWGEYGFAGISVLTDEQSYEYKPWLDVNGWMPFPNPTEY